MTTDTLDESLELIGVPTGGENERLDLTSLQVVTLVGELESVHGVTFAAIDVARENFSTRATLRALLRKKGVL